MTIIRDPKTNRGAGVDEEHRVLAFAVSQTEDKHANTEGFYNSVYFQVTPTGANDFFFYLQNLGSNSVTITDVRISSTVQTKIFIKRVSGTASAGTDSQITNRNLGSSLSPDVLAQHDVDITGLTDEGVLLFNDLSVANQMFHLKTTSTIIIPQGQAIALQREAATGEVTCLLSLSRANS